MSDDVLWGLAVGALLIGPIAFASARWARLLAEVLAFAGFLWLIARVNPPDGADLAHEIPVVGAALGALVAGLCAIVTFLDILANRRHKGDPAA